MFLFPSAQFSFSNFPWWKSFNDLWAARTEFPFLSFFSTETQHSISSVEKSSENGRICVCFEFSASSAWKIMWKAIKAGWMTRVFKNSFLSPRFSMVCIKMSSIIMWNVSEFSFAKKCTYAPRVAESEGFTLLSVDRLQTLTENLIVDSPSHLTSNVHFSSCKMYWRNCDRNRINSS